MLKALSLSLFLCLSLFVSKNNLYAQNCGVGAIALKNQTEIDDFQTTYGSCTTVTGNLFIFDDNNGNDNITNLDGLSDVAHVNGTLLILLNINLTDINGLSSLISVGMDLEISANIFLPQIDGLSNLNSIGRDLIIRNNSMIENIDYLSNLNSIGRDLIIEDNLSIENIDSLLNINNIPRDLTIHDNQNLTNVNGLSNIGSVGRNLTIEDNNNLEECCGLFPILENGGANVGGTITMSNNLALGNCNNNGGDVSTACLEPTVPTMSEWGLFNLALLLMISGMSYLIEGNKAEQKLY